MACNGLSKADFPDVSSIVSADATQISWSRGLKKSLELLKVRKYESSKLVNSLYRPFSKQWCYFDKDYNEYIYKLPRIFPYAEAKNQVISVTGRGATKEFSALMTDTLPDLEMISKGQCFPEYIFETGEPVSNTTQHNYTQADLGTGRELGDLLLSGGEQGLFQC